MNGAETALKKLLLHGAHMRNPDILTSLDSLSAGLHTLTEEIRAIELVTDANGEMRLGLVSKIPAGSAVECCGKGFNEGTLKVRCHGKFYFVFQHDLEVQCKSAAMSAGC